MQTKIGSFIEALSNVGIGFCIAFLGGLVIYPLVGMNQPVIKYLEVTIYFTVLSVLRSYIIRRWFNGRVRYYFRMRNNKGK